MPLFPSGVSHSAPAEQDRSSRAPAATSEPHHTHHLASLAITQPERQRTPLFASAAAQNQPLSSSSTLLTNQRPLQAGSVPGHALDGSTVSHSTSGWSTSNATAASFPVFNAALLPSDPFARPLSSNASSHAAQMAEYSNASSAAASALTSSSFGSFSTASAAIARPAQEAHIQAPAGSSRPRDDPKSSSLSSSLSLEARERSRSSRRRRDSSSGLSSSNSDAGSDDDDEDRRDRRHRDRHSKHEVHREHKSSSKRDKESKSHKHRRSHREDDRHHHRSRSHDDRRHERSSKESRDSRDREDQRHSSKSSDHRHHHRSSTREGRRGDEPSISTTPTVSAAPAIRGTLGASQSTLRSTRPISVWLDDYPGGKAFLAWTATATVGSVVDSFRSDESLSSFVPYFADKTGDRNNFSYPTLYSQDTASYYRRWGDFILGRRREHQFIALNDQFTRSRSKKTTQGGSDAYRLSHVDTKRSLLKSGTRTFRPPPQSSSTSGTAANADVNFVPLSDKAANPLSGPNAQREVDATRTTNHIAALLWEGVTGEHTPPPLLQSSNLADPVDASTRPSQVEDLADEVDPTDASVAAELGRLNEFVRLHPRNVDGWMRLVEFQETLLSLHSGGFASFFQQSAQTTGKSQATGKAQAWNRSSAPRMAVAEMQLAILERALRENPASPELARRYLSLGHELWPSAKLAEQWERIIFQFSTHPVMWREYLLFCQSHVATFSMATCLSGYRKCFSTLSGINERTIRETLAVAETAAPTLAAATIAIQRDLLDITSQLCDFLRDSGCPEKAVALYQALVELCWFAPTTMDPVLTPSTKTTLKGLLAFFEPFWDSSVPRFSDAGAAGWRAWHTQHVVNQTAAQHDIPVSGMRASSPTPPSLSQEDAEFSVYAETLARQPVERPLAASQSADGRTVDLWLNAELKRDSHHWRPLRMPPQDADTLGNLEAAATLDELIERDPEQVVLFEDISAFLFRITAPEIKEALLWRFVEFLGGRQLLEALPLTATISSSVPGLSSEQAPQNAGLATYALFAHACSLDAHAQHLAMTQIEFLPHGLPSEHVSNEPRDVFSRPIRPTLAHAREKLAAITQQTLQHLCKGHAGFAVLSILIPYSDSCGVVEPEATQQFDLARAQARAILEQKWFRNDVRVWLAYALIDYEHARWSERVEARGERIEASSAVASIVPSVEKLLNQARKTMAKVFATTASMLDAATLHGVINTLVRAELVLVAGPRQGERRHLRDLLAQLHAGTLAGSSSGEADRLRLRLALLDARDAAARARCLQLLVLAASPQSASASDLGAAPSDLSILRTRTFYSDTTAALRQAMLQLVGGRDLVSLSDGEVRALLQSVLAALTPEATLPCLNWTWAQQLLDGTESAVETLAGLVSSVAALVHRVRDNDAAQADLAAAGSRRGGSNSPLATILLTGNAQAIADKPLSYHSPLFYHGTRGYYADLQVGCIMLEQVFGTASLLVTHCSSLGTSLVSGRVPSELGKSVMGRGLQWFPHSLLLRRAWHALRREQGRYQRLLSGLGELAMESGPLGLAFAIEDERTAGSRVHQAGGFDEETESMQGRINRIRAVLARAFDPTSRQCEGQFQSEVRHCVPLWRMFLQFEASCVFREEAAARVRERDLLVTLETKTSGLLERQEGQQLLQAERLRFLQPTSAAAPPQQHQTTGDGAENAELERLKSGFHKRLEDERRRRHRRQRQRLTGVFVRALQQCPWAKVLYLDAIQCGLYRGPLHPDLATQLQMVRNPHDWDDSLQDVVDLMQEKGLHVRTSVEEIEALDHVDAHRANDGSAMTF